MLAHRVIPTLLHRGPHLIKGMRFDSWRTVGHLEQAVRIHQGRNVDELILLNIDGLSDFDFIEKITRGCFMPLTVGGGVRTVDDVGRLLRAGADKVSMCSGAAHDDFALIRECARKYGSQAIVAAVDYRGGTTYTDRGRKAHTLSPSMWACEAARAGAGEILLTCIDREGTMEGYDLRTLPKVASLVDVPVIAHGGCGSYADMEKAIRAGACAVAAGALFQFTDATPRGAIEHLSLANIEVRL